MPLNASTLAPRPIFTKKCAFFGWGKCRYGIDCQFFHDETKLPKDPSVLPCKFKSANEDCPHGENCWFSHDLVVRHKVDVQSQKDQKIHLEVQLSEKKKSIKEQQKILREIRDEAAKLKKENLHMKQLFENSVTKNETLKEEVEHLKDEVEKLSAQIISIQKDKKSFDEKSTQTCSKKISTTKQIKKDKKGSKNTSLDQREGKIYWKKKDAESSLKNAERYREELKVWYERLQNQKDEKDEAAQKK